MRFAFEGVWSVIKSIGGSFTDVWSNGTGEQISEHLLGIWTNINNTIGYVSRNFSSAWSDSSGTKIIQDILDIFNDILDTIENITADTVEWAQNIDFSPLITSFENVTSALKPLTADIFDGIEWFWDNILLPMASWTISTLIPTFLNLLAAAIKVLDSAISALKPMGKWLWDKFLKPIATWTGGIIVGALKGITSALNGVSDWIKNHQTAVENFAVVVGTLGSAFAISGIIQGVVSAFAALAAGTSVLTPLITALGVAVNFLTSPITLVCLGIGALIAIGVLLYKNWETVKQFFIDLWDSFKMTIQQFVDWVTEVWTSIKDFFAGIWQGIKDVFAVVAEWFTGIFQAAWDGILSVWNAVIGWFSNLWTGIKDIFSAVGSWFGDIFTTAWTNIKSAFSATAQFFRDLWTAIKSPFIKVADWFKDIFSKAWQAVKDVFSTGGKIFDGIKEGITGVFTTVVNGIIGGINKVISTPLDFLNGILNDIRDIEIAGFTPFDEFWDYDPIPVPQIPMLATGAVIPPNSEFLAVLGDQKRGTNIEAPLDTIKQALFEALAVYGGAVGNQKISVTIPIEVKGRVLSQIVIDDINDFIKRNGKSPIKV
ncbi:phage tail protein [Ruminococcus sp.]